MPWIHKHHVARHFWSVHESKERQEGARAYISGTIPEEWGAILEVAIFDKLAEDKEVSPARPRGTTAKSEKPYEQTIKNSSDKASISVNPPQSLKKTKPNEKKRAPQKGSSWENKVGWQMNNLGLMTTYVARSFSLSGP